MRVQASRADNGAGAQRSENLGAQRHPVDRDAEVDRGSDGDRRGGGRIHKLSPLASRITDFLEKSEFLNQGLEKRQASSSVIG